MNVFYIKRNGNTYSYFQIYQKKHSLHQHKIISTINSNNNLHNFCRKMITYLLMTYLNWDILSWKLITSHLKLVFLLSNVLIELHLLNKILLRKKLIGC